MVVGTRLIVFDGSKPEYTHEQKLTAPSVSSLGGNVISSVVIEKATSDEVEDSPGLASTGFDATTTRA